MFKVNIIKHTISGQESKERGIIFHCDLNILSLITLILYLM